MYPRTKALIYTVAILNSSPVLATDVFRRFDCSGVFSDYREGQQNNFFSIKAQLRDQNVTEDFTGPLNVQFNMVLDLFFVDGRPLSILQSNTVSDDPQQVRDAGPETPLVDLLGKMQDGSNKDVYAKLKAHREQRDYEERWYDLEIFYKADRETESRTILRGPLHCKKAAR